MLQELHLTLYRLQTQILLSDSRVKRKCAALNCFMDDGIDEFGTLLQQEIVLDLQLAGDLDLVHPTVCQECRPPNFREEVLFCEVLYQFLHFCIALLQKLT